MRVRVYAFLLCSVWMCTYSTVCFMFLWTKLPEINRMVICSKAFVHSINYLQVRWQRYITSRRFSVLCKHICCIHNNFICHKGRQRLKTTYITHAKIKTATIAPSRGSESHFMKKPMHSNDINFV